MTNFANDASDQIVSREGLEQKLKRSYTFDSRRQVPRSLLDDRFASLKRVSSDEVIRIRKCLDEIAVL